MDKLMASKIEVLSAFPVQSSIRHFDSHVQRKMLVQQRRKNEISIDDYLLNNTPLSVLYCSFCLVCECVCVCVSMHVVVADDA